MHDNDHPTSVIARLKEKAVWKRIVCKTFWRMQVEFNDGWAFSFRTTRKPSRKKLNTKTHYLEINFRKEVQKLWINFFYTLFLPDVFFFCMFVLNNHSMHWIIDWIREKEWIKEKKNWDLTFLIILQLKGNLFSVFLSLFSLLLSISFSEDSTFT